MESLKIKLKQHTPIIHFQHNQDGATLRATEVKPKLDRFILTKLGEDCYEKGKEKAKENGWLIGKGDHPALNYKMRIDTEGKSDEYLINSRLNREQQGLLKNENIQFISPSPYFAQEKETGLVVNKFDFNHSKWKGIPKKGIMQKELLTLSIFTLIPELQGLIKDNIQTFFLIKNFGTRQSKGFGCFQTTKIDNEPTIIDNNTIINLLKSNSAISGIFLKEEKDGFEKKLQIINNTYSLLKRGQSNPGYEKSKLWEYMCSDPIEKKITWEKKKIKAHIKKEDPRLFSTLKYDIRNPKNWIVDEDTTKTPMYIRALLGLAENYEFTTNDNSKLKVAIVDTLSENEATKKYAIDRFKSPIRFIVTDNSIFLITYNIPELLYQWKDDMGAIIKRKFRFTILRIQYNNSFELEIPSNFDIACFIEQKGGYGKNLKQSKP